MALISPFISRSLLVSLQTRQTGPAQCQPLCSPLNDALSKNCPVATCCTTSFETKYFECLECIGTSSGFTDFAPAQQQLDALLSECKANGFMLPSLTLSSAAALQTAAPASTSISASSTAGGQSLSLSTTSLPASSNVVAASSTSGNQTAARATSSNHGAASSTSEGQSTASTTSSNKVSDATGAATSTSEAQSTTSTICSNASNATGAKSSTSVITSTPSATFSPVVSATSTTSTAPSTVTTVLFTTPTESSPAAVLPHLENDAMKLGGRWKAYVVLAGVSLFGLFI